MPEWKFKEKIEIPESLMRDFFAGLAMMGILANPSIDDLTADQVASDAFLYADAMLRERTK